LEQDQFLFHFPWLCTLRGFGGDHLISGFVNPMGSAGGHG